MQRAIRRLTFAFVALLIVTGLFATTVNQPREAEAQTPLELQALCVNYYTSLVSMPTPITSSSCPAGAFALQIPDDFPFTLAVNPYTGQVLYNPNPAPPYIPIVFPDAGTVSFCVSAYTGQLRYLRTGSCPAGAFAVNVVGETEPVAVDDGPYTTLVTVTLDEPAPGLLANDDLGLPDAEVVSFGITDAVSATADGVTSLPLAGGSLTVGADGAFTLATPTVPGDYSFQYRIENSAGFDDATVTIQVQQLPDAVDDSYTTPPNTTLSVATADPDDLLDNDDLGFPEAELVSFGLADATATPADGVTQVALAGGQLTVDSDGSFELANPTGTGTFTFLYRLENAAGSDDATVTIQIDAAPTVVSTVPIDTATNVAVDTDLTITFSEDVTPAGDWFTIVCVTSGTYTPSGSGGTAVTVTGGPASYTLDPASDFTAGELCNVTILAAQITDVDTVDPPDTMENDYLFSFTTDLPPTVSSTSPLDNATDVPVDSTVSVTFSEPVDVTGSWFEISCTTSGAHTAAVSGGPTVYTLTPDSPFVLSEECTVTLVADQISDVDTGDPPDTLDGNGNGVSEGSTTDDYSFSFTTPDAPPQVASTVPVDTATSIDPTANLTITFTEAVTVTGDWVEIVCDDETFNPTASGGATMITVDASGDPVYSLDPDSDLPGGVTCTVTITADNVSDDDTIDPPDTLDGNGNNVSEGSPTDDYSFSFGTVPVAVDDSYASTGNVGIVVPEADGVILGVGADEGDSLVVDQVQGSGANVGVATATAQGGSVTLAADGSFTYDPPAGYTGDDTFTYQVSGPSGTSNTATVTITVADMLWFIDNDASGSSNIGTLTNPFTSIAGFNGSGLPGTGDTVFIHTGSGDYTTGIDLQNDQLLIGQAAGASIESISGITLPSFSRTLPVTGGTAPVLTDAAGNGVDLATGNLVRGLDIGATGGTGLNGTEVGTLFVSEVNISGSGGGVDLRSTTGAAIDVTLASLSATSTTDEGVFLDSVSGSFDVTATTGTLAMTNVAAVHIVGESNPNQVSLGLTFASVTSTNSAATGIRLSNASGSFTVSGLIDIDNPSTYGVQVNDSPATVSLQGTTEVDGAGVNAIDLSGANGAVTIASVDLDTFDDHGLRVQGNTNAVTVSAGTINDTDVTSADAVRIDGNSGNVTVAASVTKTNAGEVVAVLNRSGGTVSITNTLSCTSGCTGINVAGNTAGSTTFSGSTTVNTGTNTAVNLTSNTGHTISFSGGLDVDTSSGVGINATGGGTLNVTGANNTVNSTAATAINVNSTTIGGSGMTFQQVSSAGATHGIRLNTTGTGAFTVTGTGSTNGSGGTVANITQRGAEFISASNISLSNMTFTNANTANGAASDGTSGGNENTDENGAIHLQTVANVSLTNVDINGTAQHGINGNLVTNLDIANSVIENTGNAIWESGVYIFQLRGTQGASQDSVFNNNTIRDSGQFNVFVRNDAATNAPGGAMDRLVFQGASCLFADSGNNVPGDHVTISNRNTANFQTVVTGCTFTAVAGQTSDSIQVDAGDTSRSDAQITGSSFSNGNVAINISGSGTSTTTFNVSNNPTVSSQAGSGVNIALNGDSNMSGTINTNTISTGFANNNGFGIDVVVDQTGSATVSATGNTITGYAIGIRGGARNTGTGEADLTLSGNNITTGGNFAFNAIQLFAGNGSGGESNAVCVNLSNNTTATGFGDDEYFLEQYAGNTFQLQGFAGDGTNAAQVESFVAGTDTGTPSVDAAGGLIVNYTAATCATP